MKNHTKLRTTTKIFGFYGAQEDAETYFLKRRFTRISADYFHLRRFFHSNPPEKGLYFCTFAPRKRMPERRFTQTSLH